MGQSRSFQIGMNLLDDRVLTVRRVGRDRVQRAGGEERVETPGVEQCCLPVTRVGLRSGMRRTTNRPGTCWAVFLELNAVNGISATSARDTHVLVVSSKTASVYSIGVHPSSGILALALVTSGSNRKVTDDCAPAHIAAATVE